MNVEIARQIRRFIPSPDLRAACHSPADFDMDELRKEFADFVMGQRRKQYESWQQAWNDWTRAHPHQPGLIRLTQRCRRCNGKGIDLRRATMCYDCMGRRRTTVTVNARYLTHD